MADRDRIDRLLVARGLAPSRTRAQALLVAGKVVVGDQRVDKPGTLVPLDADIRIKGEEVEYVSRGGFKLAGALDRFTAVDDDPLLVAGRVAMDVGASTGGFSDCLLQRGVTRVHAVDVGYGQLAWKLACDERVVVHDRRNIRKLTVEEIGEPIDLVTVDCSFISLTKVLPHLPQFLDASGGGADVVALVKPQFELGPGRVGKGGIVRDEAARREALERVGEHAREVGFAVRDHVESSIEGRTGNREWLIWLRH